MCCIRMLWLTSIRIRWKTSVFPREMGRKIGQAEEIRYVSDYDDFILQVRRIRTADFSCRWIYNSSRKILYGTAWKTKGKLKWTRMPLRVWSPEGYFYVKVYYSNSKRMPPYHNGNIIVEEIPLELFIWKKSTKEGAGYGSVGYNDKCKWIFEELMFVPYIQF